MDDRSGVASRPTAREIGLWTGVALVVGNMIGSGVFLLPASLAPFGGGITLIGWLVSGAGAIALALVFARLSRLLPAAGGPYAYTRAAFGDLAGFLVAWSYWISIWTAMAALAVAAVGYLGPFLPDLVASPAASGALAIALVWSLVLVNASGVGAAGRVQVATTVLKALPLVAIGLIGITAFTPSRFALPAAGVGESASGVLTVVTLTLWAFLGLESSTIPASRVAEPSRTIPRATVAGTVVATAIYVVSTVGVMSLVPLDVLAVSTAPFADAARIIGGSAAEGIVAIGAAISCLGALNGWALLAGQLPMAAAGDGLFPSLFGRLSGRGVPLQGIVVAGLLATGLVMVKVIGSSRGLVELFTSLILLSTLGTLVPYLFCSLAVLRVGGPPARGVSALGVFAFAYALFAVAGAGQAEVYWGFLLLVAGLPVYVWVTRGEPVASVS